MKRMMFIFAAVFMLVSMQVFGTGQGGAGGSGGTQTVVFWYNHTGDEAKVWEQIIAAYNASQSKYKVEGLSVSDQQKMIVAMSGNEGPDAVTASNQNVSTYQGNGLLSSLKPFIDREKFDLSGFSNQALAANTINSEVWGLPYTAYTIQMFYNKDLLAAAGYSAPPQTMEDLYEMAVKATKLDSTGNIDVLGYPLFPLASARQELIYGFGGRWWAADGKTLTPQSPGVLESLNYNVRYRKLYGVEKVQAFITTANANRYTEQDMFFAGKQLFRLDGSWLPTMMKNFKSTVNYGIALIPGTKANPGLRGSSRFETDSLIIPTTGKNKDGAWDFIKYVSSPAGAKQWLMGTGNMPARTSLYTDTDLLARPGSPEFIDANKQEKGIQYPQIKSFSEYVAKINEYLDYVYAGQKTPEQAMTELAAQIKDLK